MGTVTPLLSTHPLIGRWRTEEDDARTEYHVFAVPDGISITGKDIIDGEAFEISDIWWSEKSIEFKTYMPSTGRKGHIVLTYIGATKAVTLTYTFTDTCTAYRADEIW
jgi:hypothetical protein